jgi:2-oxoglutarate/2-oxoacid ferredoxin oxidoreductase subunit beta
MPEINGTDTNGHGAQSGAANGAGDGPGNGHSRRLASLTLVPKATVRSATKDFKSDQEVRWCPGCGDYAILAAFQAFLPELDTPRENVVVISGIGCSSRLPYYVDTYGMHSIHGRAPAIATGLAASRPDLSVWVITGDGDALSIGGNHLIHALRRNVNLNILLFNNRIYGLTKGQYSPTSEQGKVTKSTPFGSLDHPFNPVSLALGADHQGAAFIEIYQNCPIFNDDAFEPLKQPASAGERLIRLEHGAPVRFGPGAGQGLRFGRHGQLEAIDVATADPDTLITHDAHRADPSYAFALSRLDTADFQHTPVGVFRQVEQPSYDRLMADQIAAAQARSGPGDLGVLLHGSDTWEVS